MLLVAGFAAAYPDADPALVLTDAGMAVLEDVRSTGRRDTAAALTLATAGAEPANLVRLQLGDVSAAGHRMVVQRHRKIFHRMFHLRVTPRPRWLPSVGGNAVLRTRRPMPREGGMIAGYELLVHERMASRRREAHQERLARVVRPRPRPRVGWPRPRVRSRLMLVRHALRGARPALGGGRA